MPYIDNEQRELIDGTSDFNVRDGLDIFLYKMGLFQLHDRDWQNPGILNYIITRLCHWWLGDNPNYAKYNELIGVLECAKMELYRRKVAPYEDKKIIENGDV